MAPFIQKTVYSDPMVDYLNYAADIRGRIINNVAEMERGIDDYICRHFCATIEKRNELMEVVISNKHTTFSAKADIARCILERSGDATKEEAKKIWRHLTENIANKRNMIAHYTLDTSIGSINKFKKDKRIIYLLKYSNIKTVEAFSKTDAKNLLELIFNVKQYFWGLKASKYQKSLTK